MELEMNNVRIRVHANGSIETYRDFKFINSVYTKCNPEFVTEECHVDVDGYAKVCIRNKYFKVHAIVAMAYLQLPYSECLSVHRNKNKTDNRVENLQLA
jgi:hypothetical protein